MQGLSRGKRIAILTLGGLTISSLAAAVLLHLAGCVPQYYHAIDGLPPEDRAELTRQFVRNSTGLLNQIQNDSIWAGRFRDTEVNAWLASDFDQKHSDLLPAGGSDPRVCFDNDRVSLAFQYRWGPVMSLVSVTGRLWAPRPDVVAMEFERIRAGQIPLPFSTVMDTLSDAARSAGLTLEWKQHEGHPVALLKVARGKNGMAIDRAQVTNGALVLGGHTRSADRFAGDRNDAQGEEASGVSLKVHSSDAPLKR